MHNIWIYIILMALVSYVIRSLPILLIRKQITNPFIQSVLYYLPYVTLSVMTVPAIFAISENPLCGVVALISATLTAWFTSSVFLSAVVACLSVFILIIL